jgi:hypothetical protein
MNMPSSAMIMMAGLIEHAALLGWCSALDDWGSIAHGHQQHKPI